MVDSDSKDATDDSDEEERDAPTSVAKVSERLLKALKERNATDAKVVSSAPPSKQEAPTQPPPPPDKASDASDEDESATNVLLTEKAPIRRVAPAPPAVSDEDQSETLYAITAKTGQTPAVPAVKKHPPAKQPEEAPATEGPIVSPLAPPPPGIWWWLAPLAVAIGIAALVTWVLVNH